MYGEHTQCVAHAGLVDWVNKWMNALCDFPDLPTEPCSLPRSHFFGFTLFYKTHFFLLFQKYLRKHQALFGKDSSQLWALIITMLAMPPRSVSWIHCGFNVNGQIGPRHLPAFLAPTVSLCVHVCVPFSLVSFLFSSLLSRNKLSGKNTDLEIGTPGFKKCPYH